MSTKPNALRNAMLGIQASSPPASAHNAPQPISPPREVSPSRLGKRAIGGHFTPEASKQIRLMSAELDRSVQSLLEEALNDLFRKYNKSAVA